MDKTPTQAQITRQRNKAAREAARAQRDAQEKADKALVLEVVRNALKDKEATTAQRLFAVAVLDNMQNYRFVPHDVRHPLQTEDVAKIDAEIMERLEKIEKK